MNKIETKENVERVHGEVTIRHVASRNGKEIPLRDALSQKSKDALLGMGFNPDLVGTNLVVNTGRFQLAKLIRGVSSAFIDRVQLGDTKISGVVSKSSYPADLSDVGLVNEVRTVGGLPGATFALDSNSSPDEVVKVDASTGTPGTLVAGVSSVLTDITGADFVASGVTERDTVTVVIGGEDYTLGVNEVLSATELEVSNPAQLAGSVGYTVQTPGTQALFSKTVSGDDFPLADYGPVTVVHEAGLLFSDGTLFNRITFQPTDDTIGLLLQPTDIDGTRIDIQLDWLITF